LFVSPGLDGGRPPTLPGPAVMRLRRQIKHTIPEPKRQWADRQGRSSKGDRPVGFDTTIYKRAYVFHGTVTVASIRLCPNP